MEDVAANTRKSNTDVVLGSTRAAQLLQLDSEIRALSKTSSVLGTVTLAASPTKKEAPLMSQEDLEFSIGMGSDDEDEDADEDVGDVDDVDVKGLQGIVEDGIFEVDDGWMLCESWQSCPIGSYIPFK